jgi:hypothetical protein
MGTIHTGIGRELCFSVWEENFNYTKELLLEGNGDIISFDKDKMNSNEYHAILQAEKHQCNITNEQIKFINKLLNN